MNLLEDFKNIIFKFSLCYDLHNSKNVTIA